MAVLAPLACCRWIGLGPGGHTEPVFQAVWRWTVSDLRHPRRADASPCLRRGGLGRGADRASSDDLLYLRLLVFARSCCSRRVALPARVLLGASGERLTLVSCCGSRVPDRLHVRALRPAAAMSLRSFPPWPSGSSGCCGSAARGWSTREAPLGRVHRAVGGDLRPRRRGRPLRLSVRVDAARDLQVEPGDLPAVSAPARRLPSRPLPRPPGRQPPSLHAPARELAGRGPVQTVWSWPSPSPPATLRAPPVPAGAPSTASPSAPSSFPSRPRACSLPGSTAGPLRHARGRHPARHRLRARLVLHLSSQCGCRSSWWPSPAARASEGRPSHPSPARSTGVLTFGLIHFVPRVARAPHSW
jgi:hypothetical protein